MIAIKLTVQSADSGLWLDLVRERLRRFETVPLPGADSLIWVPRIGAILATDLPHCLTFHAVANDESMMAFMREALASELASAVPESTAGHRLTLAWEYPGFIPAALRS